MKWSFIKPEEIAISLLKEKLVTNDEGWMRWEALPRTATPTGCFIFDHFLRILETTTLRDHRVVAQRLGVRPIDLEGLLRMMTGMGGREFINSYRLAQARELMRYTDLALDEVGKRCGFPTAAHLSSLFRLHVGCSPMKYRARHRPDNYQSLYRW